MKIISMYTKTKPLLLTLALALAVSPALAQTAPSVDLEFSGLIESGTCDLVAGDESRTIRLRTLPVSDFGSENAYGHEPFELTAECDADVSDVSFTFSGTVASTDDDRFESTGDAGGIALGLYDRIGGNDTTIPAGGDETERTRTVATSAGRAVLPLGAAYWKTGTVTEGTLESVVTVEVTYN